MLPATFGSLEIFSGGGEIEAEYASDIWHAARLGIRARRGHETARFEVIRQLWLREAIKRWSRFRLAAGYSFNTIDSGAQSLARFSLFLSEDPEVDGFGRLTRQLLEQFLVWMPTQTQWDGHPPSHAHLRQSAPRLGDNDTPPWPACPRAWSIRRRGEPTAGSDATVHPRVRHEPARIGGEPGQAAQPPDGAQPGGVTDRDRASRW